MNERKENDNTRPLIVSEVELRHLTLGVLCDLEYSIKASRPDDKPAIEEVRLEIDRKMLESCRRLHLASEVRKKLGIPSLSQDTKELARGTFASIAADFVANSSGVTLEQFCDYKYHGVNAELLKEYVAAAEEIFPTIRNTVYGTEF
jgi:hypothetical protein